MYKIKPSDEVSLYTLFKANGAISYLHVYLSADSHIIIHHTCHGILAIHIYTLSYYHAYAYDTCPFALFDSLICPFVYMVYLIILIAYLIYLSYSCSITMLGPTCILYGYVIRCIALDLEAVP